MKYLSMNYASTQAIILSFALLIMGACTNEKLGKEQTYDLPERVDYNFHVRPILSDKCFACHGPDAANQKADLRLDIEEHAFKKLTNTNGYAIVPYKPQKSQAFLRMTSKDPELLMPPPDAHLSLSKRDIAIIEKWIEDGAEYKPHWAFVSPEKSDLPSVENISWIKQPLDHFVLNTLAKNDLKPSKQASKETLIRRVTFDLTGLPPSLEDIERFVADDRPDAYNHLVDRLLNSPAYGERMTADWLDVARYADSDGYLDDKHREFFPWRDWVIDAFNRNMPYDQFITYQIAGDQIPNATKESTLATAFNRLHKKNSEAGIVFEEYRVEYVADRTNTLGKGILGLSLECARCHDHKYDPISQKDYYQMFGFFNSTHEIGTPVYGPEQVPGPAMLLSSEVEDKKIEEIRNFISQLENDIHEREEKNEGYKGWLSEWSGLENIKNGITKATVAHYPLDVIVPGERANSYTSNNITNKNLPASLVEPIIKEGKKGNAFFVSDYNLLTLGEKIGWYDRTHDFSFQLSVHPDTIYPDAGLLWHSEEIRLGLKGYSLFLKDNRVQFVMAKTWPQNAIQATTIATLPSKEWSDITVTYDGSSKAEGISIFINGEKQEVTIDYDHLYKSILFTPDIHTYGFQGIRLGSRDKFIPFKDGGIDEIKIFDRELSALEVLTINDTEKAKDEIGRKNHKLLQDHYNLVVNEEIIKSKAKIKAARDQENELVTGIKEIMVMGDLPEPRPTYILERGAYDAHGAQVEPSTPESILSYKDSYPKNRYGLTQWLFDEQNPLTARVYVNRIWQMHFGQGIVKTSDDFGAQGSLPSHPELLDWLAIYFIENDWDIKALHKMIVTSATYMQQSKVTNELLDKDPENMLLARGPRYRMPAEMIRDNALAISGLLVDKQGGPSTYPYQPDGLWDGLTTKHWAYRYLQEDGEGLYRRSIYTIWKRASPPPFMQIFDLDDRGDCEVNRRMSSTPLQALSLLNDPQFVEASRVLAENIIKNENDTAMQLEKVFKLLTGRAPDDIEQNLLEDFYKEELSHFKENKKAALAYMKNGSMEFDKSLNTSEIAALGTVANSIMNTSEAYTKK